MEVRDGSAPDGLRYPERASDPTTIAAIWPKLTPEQRRWIDELSPDERAQTERLLDFYGEAHFLRVFAFYRDQLEYVRSL